MFKRFIFISILLIMPLVLSSCDGEKLVTPSGGGGDEPQEEYFVLSIEKIYDQMQGQQTEVSIYLDSASTTAIYSSFFIGGFDLLITYNDTALAGLSIEPGDLIDDSKFEYFTYRFGPNIPCDGCPHALIRIVGLREVNDGTANDNHITGPGELAKLNFLVTNDRNWECRYIPVQFYWNDCGDNMIADENGYAPYSNIKVYDSTGNDITDQDNFGYGGLSAECFDTSNLFVDPSPDNSIYYRNGGVKTICADTIDDRGDVNYNGIANEIADAVVFTNYFVYGYSAFTVNLQGQIAATEINGDGYVLGVADLVYLIRIIIGDALPFPQGPQEPPNVYAHFIQDNNGVKVNTNDLLGAVFLIFDGQVELALDSESGDMDLIFHYDGGKTRALIFSFDYGTGINSGNILHVNGSGTLVYAETAGYEGYQIRNVSISQD